MKKIRSQKGFTLMETLVALAVLAILVMGMGATMNTAVRIYGESIFESNSGSLSGILNTSISDVLRFSTGVAKNTGKFTHKNGSEILPDEADFVFSSRDYGVNEAYFFVGTPAGGTNTVVQLKNLVNTDIQELVNTGAYPDLAVTDFKITFVPPARNIRGNYFDIVYKIQDTTNSTRVRDVKYTVRLLNPAP